jgi:tetratricopeptide (TPR) repeat protein
MRATRPAELVELAGNDYFAQAFPKSGRTMPLHDIQDAIELLENHQPDRAAVLLEGMADEMPVYATARVLLARAYEALDQWDRALATWREALHLIPNSPVIHRGLERSAAKAAPGRHRDRQTPQDPSGTPLADEPSEPQIAQPPAPQEHQPARPPAPQEHQPAQSTTPQEHPSARPPAPQEHPAAQRTAPQEHHRAEPPAPQEHQPAERDAIDEDTPAVSRDDPGETDAARPHYDDLDRLISELEAARIVPRPDFDNIPSPELDDDIEDVVSETLARIYASQGQYDEAARVYEILAGQHPDEASEYMQKALEMRSRASDG